jgi:ketosteroid isomerase-like protein
MSEHADTVQRAYEAFKAQDADALIEISDPEIEFGGSAAAPDHLYRGHDGIRKYMDDIDGAFGHEWDAELERVADAGQDKVLLVARIFGPGKGGLPLDLHLAHIWELRGGKLYRGKVYVPAEEALRAVGVDP